MLGLTDADLKQSRFYRDVFGEGKSEGRQEEGQALVLRQLTRRLGALSHDQTRRVCELDLERIEALAEALLDFSTAEDLDRWLEEKSH